jgi:hypothetical protein
MVAARRFLNLSPTFRGLMYEEANHDLEAGIANDLGENF